MSKTIVQAIEKYLEQTLDKAAMVHSLLTEDPAVLIDIMQDLDDRTRIATTDSARARMTTWSAWAVTATEGSSGKAHNLSRTKTGTVDDKGLV